MTTARIIITLGAVSPCGSGQLVLGEAMMSNSINESTDTVHRASTMHLGNKYAVAEERGGGKKSKQAQPLMFCGDIFISYYSFF